MRRSLPVLSLAAAVVLMPGCGSLPELPTAPSEFSAGVILYEHANYLGNASHITGDIADLRDYDGPCHHDDGENDWDDWDDCVSSIKVAPGWRATLYRGAHFTDDALEVVGDVPNLQLVRGDCPHDGLNDCVSSLRVR